MTQPSLAHRLSPMVGRDPHDHHRTATPLELLFDLAFVAAFGTAGSQFAHVLSEGHLVPALGAMSFAMFAIIWAWINFTWFSSAFDTDDWFYRITTLVQMVGVVILAIGLPDVFHSLDTGHGIDNAVMVAGYVVMRVAMLTQWLRLAVQSPQYRRTALTYAGFTLAAQIGWVLIAVTHLPLVPTLWAAAALYLVELGGPVVAERGAGATPWHPHHVAERYGLLTLIALGECVLGTIASVTPITEESGWTTEAVILVVAGLLVTFGLWWSYFAIPFGDILQRNPASAFIFGYGHLFIFSAVAAIGAGLHVAASVVEGTADIGWDLAVEAVAIPVGVFLTAFFVIYALMVKGLDRFHLLLFAGVILALVTAVLLVNQGVSFAVCVMIVALAPAIVVVGFETIGYRHAAEHLTRLG